MTDPNTEKYYSDRAPEYEQIYYRDVPARRKEIDNQVTWLKDLVAGKTVLDLACGTGYWTKVISETAKEVLATDLSEAMLAEARGKKYAAPVTFLQANMFKCAFDRKFDFVTVGFWFSHHPRQDYGKFFDLVKKPLVESGRIWLIDNNPPAEGHRIESVRVDEYGNNYKKRSLDNGTEYVIVKNYFGEEELRKIFSTDFKVEELNYGMYYWSTLLRPRN